MWLNYMKISDIQREKMEERYKFYFLDGPSDAKKMEINVQAGFIFIIRREVDMGKIGNHSSKRNHTKGRFFFLRMVEIKKWVENDRIFESNGVLFEKTWIKSDRNDNKL